MADAKNFQFFDPSVQEKWTCERCTLLNDNFRTICEVCGNEKPKVHSVKQLQVGLIYTRDVGKRQISFVG